MLIYLTPAIVKRWKQSLKWLRGAWLRGEETTMVTSDIERLKA